MLVLALPFEQNPPNFLASARFERLNNVGAAFSTDCVWRNYCLVRNVCGRHHRPNLQSLQHLVSDTETLEEK